MLIESIFMYGLHVSGTCIIYNAICLLGIPDSCCQSNNLFASEKKKTETFIMFKNLGIQKEDFSKKYSINFIKGIS